MWGPPTGAPEARWRRDFEVPLEPRAEKLSPSRLSIGAGEGIRTLDPDLGKVVLYP
jgi:hypothetical protein